jgi:uncharacterized protein (DUF2235 family)
MKRIITCSDGTWNKPTDDSTINNQDTNVFKIYDYITTGKDASGNTVKQLKFYDKGVGTSTKKSTNILEGITGEGLDENIKDAYRFITENYEEGDEIYLFGFSRGAYTARSTAGCIRNSGLLKNGYYHLLDEAFELYRDRTDSTKPDSDKMKTFKDSYCYEPRIKMIGVWDTVGSLGIPLNIFQQWNHKRYAFHDVMLSRSVDYAYHALALHERRTTFTPTLWEKNEDQDAQYKQVLEQVWFRGVHSNVGGGYPDAGLSNIALKWMICKAQKVGLAFTIQPEFIPDINGALVNSATWYYKLLGLGWRDICTKTNTLEKIHISVKKSKTEDLPPKLQKTFEEFLLDADDEFAS